jgi:tripartite-type tricarboxylate transporter receptor subunit TctC
MKLPRRTFLHLAAGAAALPAVSRTARAQAYPSRPVRLIIGIVPGSGPDIVGRLLGQWLSDRLGQPFVIENRPGAGTNIATEAVARSPADGYTLLLVTGANAINATLYEKLNFNFISDIAPVASISRETFALEVNPSFPAKTVPEFIAHAKANPGKLSMASPGSGTGPHLAGELFKMMAGVDLVHVPYRGSAPALTDLMGGQVQVTFGPAELVDPICQGREAPCARRIERVTFGCAAGHSDARRFLAGLRGDRLVRHRRAHEHAGRDHRQVEQGDQRGHR